MSRHGYREDGWDDAESQWATIRWKGQLKSAVRGKRGQAFFVALVQALDAMPAKRLITGKLEADSEVCALGALGRYRGIDMKSLDLSDPEDDDQEYDSEILGGAFGIARQLACEVMYQNDDGIYATTPEERWEKMRKWAVGKIRPETLVPEVEP